MLMMAQGMSLMTRHSQIPVQGRATRGVKAMNLEADDQVILAVQLDPEEEIALITDAGYGKRLPYMAFSAQNRGGKGMKAVSFYKNGANGKSIACALKIKEGDRMQVEMTSGEKRGELAILIDDFGYCGEGTAEMLELPIPFTAAVMDWIFTVPS